MDEQRRNPAGGSLPEIPQERLSALRAICVSNPDQSANTQRRKVLTALQTLGHVTTFEAMRHLDVYDVRPRVLELRRQGHEIVTSWRYLPTESGRLHRIGVYSLKRGGTE